MPHSFSRSSWNIRFSCQSPFNLLVAISRLGYSLEWSSYHENIASVRKWYYVCLVHYRSPLLDLTKTKLLKVITFFSSAVGRKCLTYYFGRTLVEKYQSSFFYIYLLLTIFMLFSWHFIWYSRIRSLEINTIVRWEL